MTTFPAEPNRYAWGTTRRDVHSKIRHYVPEFFPQSWPLKFSGDVLVQSWIDHTKTKSYFSYPSKQLTFDAQHPCIESKLATCLDHNQEGPVFNSSGQSGRYELRRSLLPTKADYGVFKLLKTKGNIYASFWKLSLAGALIDCLLILRELSMSWLASVKSGMLQDTVHPEDRCDFTGPHWRHF